MAEFVVNTDQLRSNADRIAALQRELDSVAVHLGAMQLGSVLQIKASAALIARVGDCKWAAVNQSDNLGKLARGLDDIALLYDNVEKNLTDPKSQAEVQAGGADVAVAEGGVFGHIVDSFKITDLLSWLGRKSLPFSVYSAFDSLFNGESKAVTNF